MAHQCARNLYGAMRFVQKAEASSAELDVAAQRLRADFASASPLAAGALLRAYVQRGWWFRWLKFPPGLCPPICMSSATSAVHSLSLKTRGGELWLARPALVLFPWPPTRRLHCARIRAARHSCCPGHFATSSLGRAPVPIPPIVWALLERCRATCVDSALLRQLAAHQPGSVFAYSMKPACWTTSQKFLLRSMVHRMRNAPTGFVWNCCAVTEASGWMPAASLHAPWTGC